MNTPHQIAEGGLRNFGVITNNATTNVLARNFCAHMHSYLLSIYLSHRIMTDKDESMEFSAQRLFSSFLLNSIRQHLLFLLTGSRVD